MALVLIDNTATELTVSTQWGELVERSGKNMLGFGLNLPLFTLTNWDSGTSKPAVAIGSIVEVGGSFYQAGAETALTDEGGLADGVCHIKLVVAVDGLSVTPTLTSDSIPAWDSEKFGWYDGTTKFLPYELTQGGTGTTWSLKKEYIDHGKTILKGPTGIVYTDHISEKTSGDGVLISNPMFTGVHGVFTFGASNSTQLIPKGTYLISHARGDGSPPYSYVDVQIDGVWERTSSGQITSSAFLIGFPTSQLLFSDGINYRIGWFTAGGGGTVKYVKY